METWIATALARGDAESATDYVLDLLRERLGGRPPRIVMIFASPSHPLSRVMPRVERGFPGAVALGCTTAGEFVEDADAKQSMVAFALAGDVEVFAGLGTGLHLDTPRAVAEAIEALPRRRAGFPHAVGLMFLDPMGSDAQAVAHTACRAISPDGAIPVAGVAAGDDLALCGAEVALGSRVHSDAIVLATIFSRRPIGIGRSCGFSPLSRTFQVTRSRGNTVHEIDGRPAWDVWAQATAASARARGEDPHDLEGDDVTDFLLRHQALVGEGSEATLRTPLMRSDDGSIVFATAVPYGTRLRIAATSPSAQLESCHRAALEARAALGDAGVAGSLVFDSVARSLVLAERYIDSVTELGDTLDGAPLAGLQCYGEVEHGRQGTTFHNGSTLVVTFGR